MNIKRDASDKHKGVTLQKLRAIKLALDMIIENPKAQFHVAIESDGDVFIYSDNRTFIEENKNYESKNFSFFSKQVLNTLIYFIDYWLKESVNRSENIVFSFYSTNNISKENNTQKIKKLGIDSLPNEPILQLLQSKNWNRENNVIEICKKAILSEYEEQYNGKNNHYPIIEKFSEEDWQIFFSQIIWNFGMPNNLDLEKEIKQSISKYGEIKNINVSGKEVFIEAMLRKKLEDKQNEKDITQRYITDNELELICYKIINQPIDKNLFRYIDYDYKEIIENINIFTHTFIKDKYFSVNNNHSDLPIFLDRKVKYHTPEIKIKVNHLEEKNPELITKNVIVGELGDFINDLKPVFLFGEIGSGKSSIIAQYTIQENDKDNLSILIPINYIKGRITSDFSSLFTCINTFINTNISNKDPFFDFEFIINNRPVKIIFDGLDELSNAEVRLLSKHLEKLSRDYSDLIVIATGRPMELQPIINFNDWNCLTTIDLNENEVFEILKNEAIVNGLAESEAIKDSKKRIEFLKSRSELSLLSKTPLVVCLVRNFLTEEIYDETLGTLMYKILLTRLRWDEIDLKSNYPHYFEEYPEEVQREKIIAIIAEEIFNSESKRISEIKFKQIVTENITENTKNRNQVVSEAILFYKNLFLQLNDGYYSFISQPLLEICYSIELSDKVNSGNFNSDIDTNTWRPFSFSIAVNKLKSGVTNELKKAIKESLDKLLFSENNIPIAAIIISESKDVDSAKYFVEKLTKLSFRPLRTWSNNSFWGEPDTYSPFTIADAIHLSGSDGVDWFFEEYLNPKHPIAHYEESIIKAILGNIFYLKKFKIDEVYKERLIEIVNYHLSARTMACQYILPVICLVIPEEIKKEYRSTMLLELLSERIYTERSKELIELEIDSGNEDAIIDSIETMALKDDNRNEEILLLHLRLFKVNNQINKTIIDSIIKLSVEKNISLLKSLQNHIDERILKSYLKFSVLNNTKISDYAAILLFREYQEKNLYLIARPLLEKTNLYQKNTEERKKILDEVLFSSPSDSLDFMRTYRPKRTSFKGGLMEIYIYYFNKLLVLNEDIYKNDFFYIIANHPDYPILNRYSEIRNSYKDLLLKKPQYRDFTVEATKHIDFKIRSNANSILLVCFPEEAQEELENVIYMASNRLSDIDEWLRFCMKLNYSKIALENIRSKLNTFPDLSKIFALFILYHQDIKLTEEEIDTLTLGLVNKGYMFDIGDVFKSQNDLKKVSEQPEFFPRLIKILHSKDLPTAKRAASHLSAYHYNKLSKYDLGKVYVYNCEEWERDLFDFDKTSTKLFESSDFIKGFDEANSLIFEKTEKESNLLLYKKVIIDKEDLWTDFILKLTHNDNYHHDSALELLYNWFLSLRKRDSSYTEKLGGSVIELLSYPAIIENTNYNSYFPYYSLMASEFSSNDIKLENVLSEYRCKDELQVAFLCRLGFIPKNFRAEDSKTYLDLFSLNLSSIVLKRSKEDVDKIFLDSEILPDSTPSFMESIIFFGIYDNDELRKKAEAGKMTAIVASTILFCRDEKTDFATILNAFDKTGWYFRRNTLYGIFGEALFIIKEELLKERGAKEKYIADLKKNINNEKDEISNHIVDNFRELFSLDAKIEIDYLKILFSELLHRPYSLKLDLMNIIFDFALNKLELKDYTKFSKELENNIKILMNNGFRHGFENEIIPMLWMFSLMSFFIDNEQRDYSIFGFLKGLESIFIISTDRKYTNTKGEKVKIGSRDLFLHSENIYQKIPSKVIREVLLEGIKYGEPEIKSLCLMLQAFSK